MGLLDRFKALLGVDAPAIHVNLPQGVWRQGDDLRGQVVVEARTTDLELVSLAAQVSIYPLPARAFPLGSHWGELEKLLDRRLSAGQRLELELRLPLDANTPVPGEELEVQLYVQVDVRGIPPRVTRRALQILPSVGMQAVIDSLSEGLAMPLEEVGASLESEEFALLYPDCTMVAFEVTKETYARLGPAAKSLEDVFLSNVAGGVKLYLFTPDATERWQRALAAASEFVEGYRLKYQVDIEELSLVLREEDIFAGDRAVQSDHIVDIVRQALRLVGGGTEKLL